MSSFQENRKWIRGLNVLQVHYKEPFLFNTALSWEKYSSELDNRTCLALAYQIKLGFSEVHGQYSGSELFITREEKKIKEIFILICLCLQVSRHCPGLTKIS